MTINSFAMNPEGEQAVINTLALLGTATLETELSRIGCLSGNADRATATRYSILSELIKDELRLRISEGAERAREEGC